MADNPSERYQSGHDENACRQAQHEDLQGERRILAPALLERHCRPVIFESRRFLG
jgi:hypothetical protein